MRYSLLDAALVVTMFLSAGCGRKPAATPAPEASARPPVAAPSAPASAPDAPPGAAAPAEPYEDPNESSQSLTLEPLFKKGALPSFPRATIGDRECWEKVNLTGDHRKDHESVASSCGAPTGLIEYTRRAVGRLHHVHDKRDTYTIKLQGGLCYRFFAVADGSVSNLDLLVTKMNGALVENDKAKSPVAIIHNSAPWCIAEDVDYQFNLDVEGPGHGHYIFSVWARPKR